MDRYRKHDITVPAGDFKSTYEILDRHYERGDIENPSCTCDKVDMTYQFCMECSTDDYEAITKELTDNGIKLL